MVSAELWKEGDRSIVRPGTIQPHNVGHLSVPTVSLIIRTHPTPSYGSQNNYLAPDVAADYGVANIIFRKKIASLRLLARGDREDFHRAFRRVVAHHSRVENLFTLLKMIDILFKPERVKLVQEYAALGEVEQIIVRCVAYHRAQDYLTNTVKYTPGLSKNEKLATSVVASSYDETSLSRILEYLELSGHQLEIPELLSAVRDRLSPQDRLRFEDALKLFGLPDIFQERAA